MLSARMYWKSPSGEIYHQHKLYVVPQNLGEKVALYLRGYRPFWICAPAFWHKNTWAHKKHRTHP